MKICLVAVSYPTMADFGGIAVYTRRAAHALAARGHEVHVLVAGADSVTDTVEGAVSLHYRPIKWLPMVGRWCVGLGESLCVAWWLFRLHRSHHFELVEFPNWEGLGLVSAWLRIAPIVVRLHTSTIDSIALSNRQPKRGEPFLMWSEKWSAKKALAVVTHSISQRDNMQRLLSIDQIEVIPHGIEIPSKISPEVSLTVLVVGPLNTRKGADSLLEAMPLVLQEMPDARFLLAGPGDADPYAKKFLAGHPKLSSSRVQFLGFVSNEQLAELYANCAVYASASIFESFGLTFIEAMACGKPVVGCAASAMLEVVDHGETGLLVPASDASALAQAILKLLRDPELRKRMGEAGRRVAESRYSASKMGERIEAFYQKIIARASK